MKKYLPLFLIILFSLSAFSQTRTGTGPDEGEADSVLISSLLEALNNNRKLCKTDVPRFESILSLHTWYLNHRAIQQLQNLDRSDKTIACSDEVNEKAKTKVPPEIKCLFDDKAKETLRELVSPKGQASSEFMKRYVLFEELKKHAAAREMDKLLNSEIAKSLIELDKTLQDEEK